MTLRTATRHLRTSLAAPIAVPMQDADGATLRQQIRARWHRQATITTAAGVGAKVISAAARMATIPLALTLLGTERYGLWLSIGSILTWLGFIGPGLGYGLINAVSEATARDDWEAVRRHVSTALGATGVIGAVVIASTPAISHWPALTHLLGVADRADLSGDAMTLLGVTCAVFGLSLALEFVTPLCTGLQAGYLSSCASAGASVVSAGGIVLLAYTSQPTMVGVALILGLPPVLANAALARYLLLQRRPHLHPSWRLFNTSSLRTLMGFGSWMFVMQLGDLGIFQSANVLIASQFGPRAVATYGVPALLFVNVAAVCFLIVQPYWPALREAVMQEDWDFIRMTMARTLRVRLAFMGAAALAIVIAAPGVMGYLTKSDAVPTRTLLIAMSVQYLLIALSGNYVVMLLSFKLVRIKALLTLLVASVQIAGFFLLSPVIGIVSLPVAGAFGVLLDCVFSARAAAKYVREHSNG